MDRRYDIDWLRIIAIGLLLIYHIAIGFQSWGIMIGFITNDTAWSSLWLPMGMLNIWRIPFLFFVSGMGVYFAMRSRNWKQLLKERALRILLPFVFGALAIVPVSMAIWRLYYKWEMIYSPGPGHLWFLGNIFIYVLVLIPLFYTLKRHENGRFVKGLKKLFSNPLGMLPVTAIFIAEALLLKPNPYELYAMTWHGFALGLLAFFSGFCFVLAGQGFWNMLLKWRWLFVAIAVSAFAYRVSMGMKVPVYLLVAESHAWIFSCFAFGYRYLNHPGQTLRYLSEAAYPVYILHMIFLFLASYWIFPTGVPVPLKFVLVLLCTLGGCFGSYEIIRRIPFLRPLFGLRVARALPTERRPTIQDKSVADYNSNGN